MARKVFVSVLGTGYYYKCKYSAGEFVSSETRFIQQATLQKLFGSGAWTEDDRIMILLTVKARSTNWDIASCKRHNVRTQQDEDYPGLKQALENMGMAAVTDEINIPDGKDESEMWEIFDILYDRLKQGDELYFDLTHGFRYLPMLVLVLGNYAKFLKNVKIASITYGNYESRDVNTGTSPIVDLLPLAALQDWTLAAADYINKGNASELCRLSSESIRPILKATKGTDKKVLDMKTLSASLNAFTEEVKFCRGMEIYNGETPARIHELASNIGSTFIKPLNPLFSHIQETVAPLTNHANAFNCIMAARLSFHYEQYQAAVTLLQEGMVSFVCERNGIDVDDEDRRGLVNVAFMKKQYPDRYKPRKIETDEKLVDRILEDPLFDNDGFIKDFSNLTNVRNDINHSGMRRKTKPLKPEQLRKNIEKCLERMLLLVQSGLQDSTPQYVEN